MRTVLSAAILAVVTMSSVENASAQEPGRVGLVMGYPQSVGVIWQIADRLAVRPEIAFSRRSEETTTITLGTGATCGCSDPTGASSNDFLRVGVGVSALFYFGGRDDLRVYASPRFMYSTTDAPAPDGSHRDSSSYLTAGSFGAHYSLARRFAVFGEVGLRHTMTRSSLEFPVGRRESRAHSLSTGSAVGVIFIF